MINLDMAMLDKAELDKAELDKAVSYRYEMQEVML